MRIVVMNGKYSIEKPFLFFWKRYKSWVSEYWFERTWHNCWTDDLQKVKQTFSFLTGKPTAYSDNAEQLKD